ncbi:LytR/AlgR family response regulator transcription factor [Flavivirga spongiicola]|uniref:LytTR family DNA-binding domain-containing protein n=1 Tax=Flavivirga spongiicola TaxID=421621 RepID=A0ABU7XP71_9FLAO|nr:LytTR family DNA-binding domain-containing protein [Flavivirga sp. MEBiC05379]MDO5977336.1 LytTR family DNA-binding domain-containing protein [Flavivirga sp. MEBiC05379]
MIKVTVVEDESVSSNHIVNLLNKYCSEEIIVEKEIDNILDALKWFAENDNPDLIFMDIQLSDGSCFEIFNYVDINCPIIFTTAYDEYAIKAFKNNGIDYLLKPITEKDFYQAIMKFFKIRREKSFRQEVNEVKEKVKSLEQVAKPKLFKERFLVKLGNKYTPLKIDDIAYFYKDDIVFIRSFNGNNYPINGSLSSIESCIDANKFVRVNRKVIVNINAIEYLAQYKPGQLVIKLNPRFEDVIVLSQEKSSYLKNLLN